VGTLAAARRDAWGDMMDRRYALKAGLTFAALAACPGAPLTRAAQGAVPVLAAIELAIALTSLAMDMRKAAKAPDDGEMLARLNGIGARLDTLQKSIGPTLEAQFERHEIRMLARNIAAKEASIIETLERMNGGEEFSDERLLRHASEQQDFRNQVIMGDYGPDVYPLAGRAFLSEAMIYFAMRNRSVAFNTGQMACTKYFVKCIWAYQSAARDNQRARELLEQETDAALRALEAGKPYKPMAPSHGPTSLDLFGRLRPVSPAGPRHCRNRIPAREQKLSPAAHEMRRPLRTFAAYFIIFDTWVPTNCHLPPRIWATSVHE